MLVYPLSITTVSTSTHIPTGQCHGRIRLRIPIFNASQRARADAAEAEALKAKKQAEATRNQVAEDTLKLQRAAEQLEAAREVAQLEYQLAQSSLEAVQTRVDAKTGTLHELADARVQAAERYLLFQDADFEYRRVRLNLLRATGDLETGRSRTPLPNDASNSTSSRYPNLASQCAETTFGKVLLRFEPR